MLDRLLHGVKLPTAQEIAAERARRGAAGDGIFPDGWQTFSVYGDYLRLPELEQLVAVAKDDAVVGPLLERVHRRCSIRFLLGLEAKNYRCRSFDCITEFGDRWPFSYASRSRFDSSGLPRCACLAVAVETAEATEPDLTRAAACARGLAKRAHHDFWHRSRPERRRERRARRARTLRTPTSRSVAARSRSVLPLSVTQPAAPVDASPLLGTPGAPPAAPVDSEVQPAVSPSRRPPRLIGVARVSDGELQALADSLGVPFSVGRRFG